MGVQGWNRLLANEGWLPRIIDHHHKNRSTSLWMENMAELLDASHPLLEERFVAIPPGSELHIDGFCLCFHIHQVAYARYCQQVLSESKGAKKQKNGGAIPTSSKSFTPAQVRHLLPCFLPLELLSQVMQEFVQVLQDHCSMNLIVYWDGEQRFAPPTSSASTAGATDTAATDNAATDTTSDGEEDTFHHAEQETPESFKHETEVVRQSQRTEEWSRLQDYCIYGRLSANSTVSQWEREFPKNRLFITQIMHTLMEIMMMMATKASTGSPGPLQMRFCEEEADSIMAQAVTGRTGAFIVGMDSDFCFFPNSSYIPINTLKVDRDRDHKALQAVVMRRDTLADSLDLPEGAMVELAILMGNDYVQVDPIVEPTVPPSDGDNEGMPPPSPSKKQLQHKNPAVRVPALVEFLRQQSEHYQVQSHIPHVQECLKFVRTLYDLQDMSEYSYQESSGMDQPSLLQAAMSTNEDLTRKLQKATMDPQHDASVKDAVVRYLTMIVAHQDETCVRITAATDDDHENGGTPPPRVLTQSHIQAFRLLSRDRPPNRVVDQEIKDATWRPLWRDIPAVFWIERITSEIVRASLQRQHDIWTAGNSDSKITNRSLVDPPNAVFDPYLYHAMLRVARDNHGVAGAAELAGDDSQEEQVPDKTELEVKEPSKLILPVDEFEDTILESVRKNRVTIIQGDTGCGKSSRIPVMLLNAPPPNPAQKQTKLFISQPRRIAAKALVERLRSVEPKLKDQFALRMGHGVREYETPQTRAWFVTTGYLVRLLANHPERFDSISVLIIDEVHERSVDTDILCLLCRRLLVTNPHIRLVLMSATLAAALYQDYFGVPEPPIKVGNRRFPVKEVFLDDLAKEMTLAPKDRKNVSALLTMRCNRPPSAKDTERACLMAANLATVIGKPGSSVLIFVPGMNEIVAITELIESVTVPGITYTCVPIHSDIPFEDQMLVFNASEADEVKVVISTNAAESSLTLPEVENVICLGLCKQIVYNEASHRQMLMPTWISRASATQRAGRTGRVGPGTVYRLYTRESYESHMEPFEPGEMLRIPLDSVILMLKEMLTEEAVTEVLLSCLEPPNMSTIDRSFDSLFRSHFITAPDDSCELTSLGAFVSSLGIDLALGSLIGLGIQMGVGAEAIQMASILGFPKSPFVMSNPLVHSTESFNENTMKTYVSRCHFDANLFSEPLAIMNLIWDYEHLKPKNKVQQWCRFYGVFLPRMKRLASTTQNLRKRVADFFGVGEDVFKLAKPPVHMPQGILTILRVIQVWVFHETVIQFDPKGHQRKMPNKGTVDLDFQQGSDQIEPRHLEQILMKARHKHILKFCREIRERGHFEYIPTHSNKLPNNDFVDRLETRFLSYATEKDFKCVWISFANSMLIFTLHETAAEKSVQTCLQTQVKSYNQTYLIATQTEGKSRRGVAERACGMWSIEKAQTAESNDSKAVTWTQHCFAGGKKKAASRQVMVITHSLDSLCRSSDIKGLSLNLAWQRNSICPDKSFKFNMVALGAECPVLNVDLRDMLGPRVQSTTKEIFGKQKLLFPVTDNTPHVWNNGKATDSPLGGNEDTPTSSWDRPLIKCIPEGARLVSVFVSSRRRENVIKLIRTKEDDDQKLDDSDGELSIRLNRSTNVSFRWKRFDTDDTVYIDASSVPATLVPMDDYGMLYCVCANTLEVRGGGIRAEGLTLVPGKAFLLLSRFTFGLFQEANVEDGSVTEDAIRWICPNFDKKESSVTRGRVDKAIAFHHSAMDLGESLECFPAKVEELLAIFDGVDGYEARVWEALPSNPFISQNLNKHRKAFEVQKTVRYYRQESSGLSEDIQGAPSDGSNDSAVTGDVQQVSNVSVKSTKLLSAGVANSAKNANVNGTQGALRTPAGFSQVRLSETEKQELLTLFRHDRGGDEVDSCSVLAMVVQQYRLVLGTHTKDMVLAGLDWAFYTIQLDSKVWLKAVFKPADICFTAERKNTEAWMKKKDHWKARPRTVRAAVRCLPPQSRQIFGAQKAWLDTDSKTIVAETLEAAIEIEAACWLERQFGTLKTSWHGREVHTMVNSLKQTAAATKSTTTGKSKKAAKRASKKANAKKGENTPKKANT